MIFLPIYLIVPSKKDLMNEIGFPSRVYRCIPRSHLKDMGHKIAKSTNRRRLLPTSVFTVSLHIVVKKTHTHTRQQPQEKIPLTLYLLFRNWREIAFMIGLAQDPDDFCYCYAAGSECEECRAKWKWEDGTPNTWWQWQGNDPAEREDCARWSVGFIGVKCNTHATRFICERGMII